MAVSSMAIKFWSQESIDRMTTPLSQDIMSEMADPLAWTWGTVAADA